MLRLVLREHPVDVAVGEERVARVVARRGAQLAARSRRGPSSQVGERAARGAGAAARSRVRPRVARSASYIVVAARGPRRAASLGSSARLDPLLLVVRDVAEVPDDRAHERAVLARRAARRESGSISSSVRARAAARRAPARAAAACGDRAAVAHAAAGARANACVGSTKARASLEAEARGARRAISSTLELAADLGAGSSRPRAMRKRRPSSGSSITCLAREAGVDLDAVERSL